MADDQELNAAELQQLKEIAKSLPVGHPAQNKVNLLLNSQKTQFEKDRSGGGVVNALKNMIPPSPTEGRSPFDPKFWFNTEKARFDPFGSGTAYSDLTRPLSEDLNTEVLGAGKTGGNAIYRGASVLAPLAGINTERMEEDSARGDTAGVITQAAVPAALAVAAPMIRSAGGELLRRTGNTAADLTRHPATATQSNLPGGRPGSIKPILPPLLQKYVLPDWMMPKGELGTPTNPGPFSAVPSKLPPALRGDPFSPTTPPELGSLENPGLFSKIPNRMPKPVVEPPAWQPPTHETLELGSPEYPGQFSKVPSRLPPGARGDPFSPKPVQAAAETPPRVMPYSSGEPRMTGNEGRAATWTNEAVLRLASQGNREAISQAVRRGLGLPPGARYVMGDPDFSRAVYNPREVTQFTPEGQPIRNVENPTQQAPRERIQVPPSPPEAREVTNAATGEVTSPFASQRRTLERGKR